MRETRAWFSGEPVYGSLRTAVYPPAAYLFFWPFLGWPTPTAARYIWGITTPLAVAWLVVLLVRESRARSTRQRLLVGLVPLAMNATGVTIGNGQLGVHLLPVMLAGALLIVRRRTLWSELGAAALFAIALMKPTLSFPLFAAAVAIRGRLSPLVLTAAVTIALTLLAAAWQMAAITHLAEPLFGAATLSPGATELVTRTYGTRVTGGYAEFHTWLVQLDQRRLTLPAALVLLGVLVVVIRRYRRADVWLLFGIAAIFARFWTYHRLFDDVLIVIPLIALYRHAQAPDLSRRVVWIAMALFGLTLGVMLLPARFLTSPWPLSATYTVLHPVVWLADLVFLIVEARRQARDATASRGSRVSEAFASTMAST
jgi:hypothetical protein